MIVHLRGVLVEKSPNRAVIDVGGVGYEVFIPLSTFDRLGAAGDECRLFTRHEVREDAQLLFGFATEIERDAFERLTGVSGVGPKLALALLSGMNVADINLAITQGDSKRLASVKGVGKKTAERIVVELKDKINPVEAFAAAKGAAGAKGEMLRDAMLALAALGFSEEIARKNIQKALDSDPGIDSVEAIVRRALNS